MKFSIKLMNDKCKRIGLEVLLREMVHSNKPGYPSEERFLDEKGQEIEDSNLIFFGNFVLEEKENWFSNQIHLDYKFKRGEKIPKDADLIIIDNTSSLQEVSVNTNKRYRNACYAKIDRYVNI